MHVHFFVKVKIIFDKWLICVYRPPFVCFLLGLIYRKARDRPSISDNWNFCQVFESGWVVLVQICSRISALKSRYSFEFYRQTLTAKSWGIEWGHSFSENSMILASANRLFCPSTIALQTKQMIRCENNNGRTLHYHSRLRLGLRQLLFVWVLCWVGR